MRLDPDQKNQVNRSRRRRPGRTGDIRFRAPRIPGDRYLADGGLLNLLVDPTVKNGAHISPRAFTGRGFIAVTPSSIK